MGHTILDDLDIAIRAGDVTPPQVIEYCLGYMRGGEKEPCIIEVYKTTFEFLQYCSSVYKGYSSYPECRWQTVEGLMAYVIEQRAGTLRGSIIRDMCHDKRPQVEAVTYSGDI